jgi:asparagine synthase (glutamine-hydrolysing)
MEAECKRKISQLHAYDCLRANKSMGDFGIETRVPFLDKDVVDYAMNKMDPTLKLSGTHPDGPKAEKWFLRDLFRDDLPDYIVDRTKAQFSDAVGSSWIDALRMVSEQVTDEQMASAAERWSFQTPDTKEAYFYRDIFSKHFGDIEGAEETVIFQPSIACSTKQGILWHENFQKCVDPSGDAIQRAFEEA